MFSFTSPIAIGRTFSLDYWLSRLNHWFHPDRSPQLEVTHCQNEKTLCGSTFNFVFPPCLGQLSLDLPSPSINLTFALNSELSTDMAFELSSSGSSRCHTPGLENNNGDDDTFKSFNDTTALPLAETALNKDITVTALTSSIPALSVLRNFDRDTMLDKYSHQELVLLEFLTHSSEVQAGGIEQVLVRYPPGFSRACRCANMDDESNDLCEVCRLMDKYMAYSLERFREVEF